MDDVRFDAPGTESFDFLALLEANRKVLMPGNQPIGVRVLVEQQAANRPGSWTQDRACQPQ